MCVEKRKIRGFKVCLLELFHMCPCRRTRVKLSHDLWFSFYRQNRKLSVISFLFPVSRPNSFTILPVSNSGQCFACTKFSLLLFYMADMAHHPGRHSLWGTLKKKKEKSSINCFMLACFHVQSMGNPVKKYNSYNHGWLMLLKLVHSFWLHSLN